MRQENRVQRFAVLGWSHAEPDRAINRLCRGVAQVDIDVNLAGFPIRLGIYIFHASHGCCQQFHGIDNASNVISRALCYRVVSITPRRVLQRDALRALFRGIEHPDGKPIGLTGLERGGNIQFKRILRALVLADANAVDPHLRQIVHRPKPQDETPVVMRIGRGRKITPIPGHAMIVSEHILDDPRHLGGFRILGRGIEPLLRAPHVLRVRGQQPVLTIEREGPGRLRPKGCGLG